MKKKTFAALFMTISLSAAMSLTSYAGWVQDGNGWAYQYDNGSWAVCGWFTDPADGSEYYLDPDGYAMTETRVQGFWLDASGRKQEKTQAELEAEAARAAREASKPTPSRAASAAKQAANSAKKSSVAVSTSRNSYQAEMKVFMDRYFLDMANKLYADKKERREQAAEAAKEAALAASIANEDGHSVGDIIVDYSNLYPTDTRASEDNYNIDYGIYRKSDSQDIISSGYSKIVMKKSIYYIPYAFELSYNRDLANTEEERVIFDEGYRQMVIAALGENSGTAVYDQTLAGTIVDGSVGDTDYGNTYEIIFKNGLVTIQVTCGEKTEESVSSEVAETSENEQAETVSEESLPVTSSVITVGQSQKNNEQENQNEVE